MIEILEHELRAAWPEVGGARPQPLRIHIAKLSHADYPQPESALLVLMFADHDAHPVAVAKVARVAAGDAAVGREAAALRRVLERLPETARSCVPRLLRAGTANGRAFLLASALPGELEMHHTWSLSAARRVSDRIAAALDWSARVAEATATDGVRAAAWFEHEPRAALDVVARLDCPEDALRRLEARLPRLWETIWPAALAHGDYFSGNLLFDGRGVSAVVDWMSYEERAPHFLDRLTYELSFSLHAIQTGTPPALALRGVDALPPFAAWHRAAAAQGLEVGPGSEARLAVMLWGALRGGALESEGRGPLGRRWVALLAAEIETPGLVAGSGTAPT